MDFGTFLEERLKDLEERLKEKLGNDTSIDDLEDGGHVLNMLQALNTHLTRKTLLVEEKTLLTKITLAIFYRLIEKCKNDIANDKQKRDDLIGKLDTKSGFNKRNAKIIQEISEQTDELKLREGNLKSLKEGQDALHKWISKEGIKIG